jgi:hypothetical protein
MHTPFALVTASRAAWFANRVVCSRLSVLAFGLRVPPHDDVLAASIVPRCSAFYQIVRRGELTSLVPHRTASRRQVSGDNGFEPVGQLHQFELARVF